MNIPQIKSVIPLPEHHLLVTFANGVQKVYDCHQIVDLERFQLLQSEAFFKSVRVDPGGYGVSWDDERDLSEYEPRTNGIEIESSTAGSPGKKKRTAVKQAERD